MNATQGAEGYFSLDVPTLVRTPNTVTITALQLAVHMGFDPIYLIGCDTTYTIPDEVETSGEAVDPGTGERIEGYEITSKCDNDPNHFDSSYFGAGSKWHAPNVRGMIYGYKQSKIMCDRAGVQVYNATVGGALEVFPRVDIHRLLA
jgi:hypothetical protein